MNPFTLPTLFFALIDELPYSLRGVRDSFSASGSHVLIAILTSVLLLLLLSALVHALQQHFQHHTHLADSPQQLFHELLDSLPLQSSERKLLRRLARDTRLRHPAEVLLSPGLLDWATRLWLHEKGPRTVSPAVQERLAHIKNTLFETPLPANSPAA